MEFQTGGFLPETPPDAGGEFAAPRSGFLVKVFFADFFSRNCFFWIFCSIMAGMMDKQSAILMVFLALIAGVTTVVILGLSFT